MALLPINKIEKVAESRVDIRQVDVFENSISGDAIVGGKITKFRSQGIDDKADSLQLTVNNDVVEIEKDLHVKGSVRVDNLQYNHASVPKLNVQKALMIDHNEVLWKTELGRSVKKSNLEQLGSLKNLNVRKTLYAAEGRVGVNTEAPSAPFSVNVGGYEVVTKMQDKTTYVGTMVPAPFSIGTDETARITCRSNGDVVLGQEDGKPIKVNFYGSVGIGVKHPQESLHVAGNIKFQDKVFSSGDKAPVQGRWETGSIAWNDKPEINQPVGWVCVKGGTPGSWRPFGLIS
jgi:hypothetical protein